MGRSAREVCARELTLKEERGAMKKKIWLPLVLTLLLVGCGGEGEVAAPLPPESPEITILACCMERRWERM